MNSIIIMKSSCHHEQSRMLSGQTFHDIVLCEISSKTWYAYAYGALISPSSNINKKDGRPEKPSLF